MRDKSKDLWDKLDVLGRLFAGVVLVAIGLILKTGADAVKDSLDTGSLVQSLIGDLTTQGARRDVALIALYRSVGQDRRSMVVEIAERLVLDIALSKSEPGGSSTENEGRLYTTAFGILDEIDSERAAELARQVVAIKFQEDPEGARRLAEYLNRYLSNGVDLPGEALRASVAVFAEQSRRRAETARKQNEKYDEYKWAAEQKQAEASLAFANAAQAKSKDVTAANQYKEAAKQHLETARKLRQQAAAAR